MCRIDGLPGELAQVLPTPHHFKQASSLVSEEEIGEKIVCGPDPERHVAAIQAYLDAGFTEVYVTQVGKEQEGFFFSSVRSTCSRNSGRPIWSATHRGAARGLQVELGAPTLVIRVARPAIAPGS